MDRSFFRLRHYLQKRRYKVKRIHKSWVDLGTGARAVFSDLFIVLQLAALAVAYAILARQYIAFFIFSIALTVLCALYVIICEEDRQSKLSWVVLFLLSFGSGYIVYLLSRKCVCYGLERRKFNRISERTSPLTPAYVGVNAENEVKKHVDYLAFNGFAPYTGTSSKYFSTARPALNDIVARIDSAEKFVLIEFFIVADGVYLDRLISIFRRKTQEGVKIYMLYDDVGSAGVFSSSAKRRLKEAGVNIKCFKSLFAPFSFGLNFRDHRKIVVVDGKTAYTGGFNLIDDCANERKMEGIWKDAGLRLDGPAVDGFSLIFMRQWEFATREKLNFEEFLGKSEKTCDTSNFVPYAGGPEIKECICRNVYINIMESAQERLYIMTPYLVPDSNFTKLLKRKAAEGVDVRLILPGVPDYRYLYRVTTANAKRLIKHGIKIYYANGEFVHSKLMLTESCAAVASVNLDMRAFYQEFDNGVYTDDKGVMEGILNDFEEVISRSVVEEKGKRHPVSAAIALFLRLFSPLM